MSGMMGGWQESLNRILNQASEAREFRPYKGPPKPLVCPGCGGKADERVKYGMKCAGCAKKRSPEDAGA